MFCLFSICICLWCVRCVCVRGFISQLISMLYIKSFFFLFFFFTISLFYKNINVTTTIYTIFAIACYLSQNCVYYISYTPHTHTLHVHRKTDLHAINNVRRVTSAQVTCICFHFILLFMAIVLFIFSIRTLHSQ